MPESMFSWVLAGSTLVDAAVVAAVLFVALPNRQPNSSPSSVVRIGLARVALAAIALSFLFVCKTALMVAGVNIFGMMNLAYLDGVVVVPLAGLAVLLAGRRRPGRAPWREVSRPAKVLAFGSLLAVPLGMYGTYVEPYRLRAERATVALPPERRIAEPFTIGLLADLQFDEVTEYEVAALDRLMVMRPDLIVLTGDLFQGTGADLRAEMTAIQAMLRRLSASAGVFAILGNVDHPALTREAYEGAGIRLLADEVTTVTVRGTPVMIGGLSWRCTSAAAVSTMLSLESGSDETVPRLLLTHAPDALLMRSAPSRIDLALAGHTHGGQVRLPGLPPPVTASQVPRAVGAGGLHVLNGTQVYVSRGVGCERGQAPRVRLFCPPEITLLTVVRAK